jgi:hypothetical protein
MFKKLLFGVGLFGLAIASAKSYNITLAEAYTVGTTQLSAGEYKLVVNGSTAQLEDNRGNVQANGTIENEKRTFDETAVVSNKAEGANQLRAIEIGGTRFQVDFK